MEAKIKFKPKNLGNNSFQNKNIFLIFIFKVLIVLSMLRQYNFSSSFLYSNAMTLLNKNIFIIHKSGVDIYDSSLTKKIKNIITFSNDEIKGNNDIYAKNIISKNDEKTFEYITCIINDKIYIFNSEGEKLYNSENKISLLKENNYILIPIKIINNNYYYMIGYINENKNNIQILFFKFEINSFQNILLYDKPMFNYNVNDNIFNIKYKLLTCQLMKNSSNKEKIFCFYNIQNFLDYTYFEIDNYEFSIINPKKNKIELPKDLSEIESINSVKNIDNSKMFIFLNSISGKGYIFSYSINSNTFSKNIEFISNCNTAFGTKFSFFREINQFLFTCLNENNNLLNIVIFNNNFEYLNNYSIKYFNYNYGYSIVYSYLKKNYIIISDKQYQEINFILDKNSEQESIIADKIGPNKNIKLRKTEETNNCGNLKKCLTCSEESLAKNLCIKCSNGYYPINSNYFHSQSNAHSYVDCYELDKIPKNYYFDNNTNSYEPCYYTCSSCKFGGDGNVNNCTKCAKDYTEEPENPGSTNCVVSCKNFYYYTSYGQYKCSSNPQCPEEKNLLIREKKKCVDSCKDDGDKYKYQYSGECLEQCPPDTTDENFICKVKSKEVCSKSFSQFDLYDFLKEGGVEKIAKTYAKEFSYTDKHISLFKNEVYSIMLYKSSECIIELQLSMPEIDFGSCYIKVQEKYDIHDSLLVAIIDKTSSKKSNPITSYSFYHPITGEKLDSESACKEEVIVVKENIKSLLNDSVQDMNSIIFLTEQNIDVFNKSSGFYRDLCYHYESPCDKDVALRDRLLIYYPNITLCDSGCNNAGVNLTSMTAICECKYKEMTDDDEDDNSNLYQSAVNEVFNIFNQINIEVMACYKDLFDYDYFISCTGGLIILCLIFVQFINCIIYYFISFFSIQKYMYNMTENYLLYLNKSPMYKPYLNKLNDEEKKSQKENCPPKKNNRSGDVNINIFNFHSNKNQNVKIKKIDNIKKKIKTQEGLEDKNNSKLALYNKNLYKKKKEKEKSNSSVKVKLEKSKSLLSLKNEKSNTNSLVNTSNVPKNLSFFDNYLSTHLNDMLFNDALLKDKRLFFEYFCDKLKKKQVILELFLVDDPIKPKTLKLLLLILDLEVCFVINGMFINEDYISKLFHSTKEENFISFLPRSINRSFYTIIASIIISYIVGCFFVQERRLKSIFKYERNNVYAIKYEVCLVMKEMKWRYNIFILLTAVISAFSWYYISCFNNVYPHMKIEWIKSSIFIILLVHILSILVTLAETLLRFISFEIKSEKMYKASLWLG